MATINIRRFATGTRRHAALTPHYLRKNQSPNSDELITEKDTYRHDNGSNTEDYLLHFPTLIYTITRNLERSTFTPTFQQLSATVHHHN